MDPLLAAGISAAPSIFGLIADAMAPTSRAAVLRGAERPQSQAPGIAVGGLDRALQAYLAQEGRNRLPETPPTDPRQAAAGRELAGISPALLRALSGGITRAWPSGAV